MILYLAPLQGLTEQGYRNSYSRFFSGVDLAVAPFISTLHGGGCKQKELNDVLPEFNRLMPVVPQIMGNDPVDFAVVANRVREMGYSVVNWNLGCPYKMVAKKKKGSGLLCFPEMIDAFFERVFPLMKTGLSVKMRLGRHDASEIFRLMPILNRYPLDEIIIHPRTGIQMYDGGVDLDTFESALSICRHTVVYNGDIRTEEDFKTLSGRFTHIDRWMIGRGILCDPFLPMTIKYGCDNKIDKVSRVRQFHDDVFRDRCETLSGPAHVTDKMKAFWTYLAPSLEGGIDFFNKIKKTRDIDGYAKIVDVFFSSETRWIGPRSVSEFLQDSSEDK
jgi:tRNA-dihydrouridine synthase